MAASLCMLGALYVISTSNTSSATLLEIASWCGVLTLTALFIGTLSDEVNSRFAKVYEDNISETRTDALTRVANRRSFDIELQKELDELNDPEKLKKRQESIENEMNEIDAKKKKTESDMEELRQEREKHSQTKEDEELQRFGHEHKARRGTSSSVEEGGT